MPYAPGIAAPALDRSRRVLSGGGRVSEAALVRAARRGSEQAVAELFARHWSAAYRAALLVTGDRAAAEDIAQEAFLAALRALPSFDLRRPLRPWLHRIVVNRAIDWSRARALETLGPEQRAVIVLRYLLEFTPGEIARILDLPRGTVNSRLRRGLDTL